MFIDHKSVLATFIQPRQLYCSEEYLGKMEMANHQRTTGELEKEDPLNQTRKTFTIGSLALTAVVISCIAILNINLYPQYIRKLNTWPNKASKLTERKLNAGDGHLGIIWLYSFPNSGTTYFMHTMQKMSNKATATNYGTSMLDTNGEITTMPGFDSMPVLEDEPSPAFFSLLPSPDKYIVTRTHSYGTCFDCPPWKYMGPTAHLRHMNINNYATLVKDNKETTVEYSMDLVKKLLLLVRDPMDNIAARFLQKVASEVNDGNTAYGDLYAENKDGFKQFCADMDTSEYRDMERNWYSKYDFWPEVESVPCRSEFVKLFYFYNYARLIMIEYKLDWKVVTLKDLAKDPDSTMADVFNYVSLEVVGPAPENLLGDGHSLFHHFYTEDQIKAIAELGKKILFPAVWTEGFATYLEKFLS